jgi:hypothetical protein
MQLGGRVTLHENNDWIVVIEKRRLCFHFFQLHIRFAKYELHRLPPTKVIRSIVVRIKLCAHPESKTTYRSCYGKSLEGCAKGSYPQSDINFHPIGVRMN